MANFYGFARSNYFRVKDLEAFKKAMEPCSVDVAAVTDDKGNSRVALLSEAEGGWSNGTYNEETGDVEYFNIEDIVAPHLMDGEVAIFMQIGYEKLRYLNGSALAINNKGESQYVDINEIYEKAKILGNNITRAEY